MSDWGMNDRLLCHILPFSASTLFSHCTATFLCQFPTKAEMLLAPVQVQLCTSWHAVVFSGQAKGGSVTDQNRPFLGRKVEQMAAR